MNTLTLMYIQELFHQLRGTLSANPSCSHTYKYTYIHTHSRMYIQELFDQLRGTLPGRPKLFIHHVTASAAERARANVEFPLKPIPTSLDVYQVI